MRYKIRLVCFICIAFVLTIQNGMSQSYSSVNAKFKPMDFGSSSTKEKDVRNVSYATTNIANTTWIGKSLKARRFRNGDVIKQVNSIEEWNQAIANQEAAWCYLNFNPKTEDRFGLFYNWYAVNDKRGLAPAGFRVPTTDDWEKLDRSLGGANYGGKLKSKGWKDNFLLNANNVNSFNFGAQPAGVFDPSLGFSETFNEVVWWTSNSISSSKIIGMSLDNKIDKLNTKVLNKSVGLTLRCIKE